MPLENISYPVTGSLGSFSNIFPSQKRLIFSARRKDAGISSISSGVNGVVEITSDVPLTGISVGDFISWGTASYTARSSRVISVISANIIEVDEIFVSADSSESFLNFQKDYFLEIRYVSPDTATDAQLAVEIFDFQTRASNDSLGNITANISFPSSFINPDFNLITGEVDDLSVSYKIQFRESFLGNREGLWESPDPDVPILLVHASEDFEENNFTDRSVLKRYAKGFPLFYTFIKSSINNNVLGVNTSFSVEYFDITKSSISVSTVGNSLNLNGVFLFCIPPEDVPDNTVFFNFTAINEEVQNVYDPSQYDPSQYQ